MPFSTPDETPGLPEGKVVSVNVGQVQTIDWLGQTITTGIWKFPVAGRVAARGCSLDGDAQADRRAHGGRDKAIYAYAHADIQWWVEQLGRPLEHGSFGENLTIEGVDVSHAVVGERWAIGSAVFEVSQPRIPCYKLGARLGDQNFPPRFAAAGLPGAYLRIVTEGEVEAGHAVRVVHRPAHGLTVADVSEIYHRAHDRAAEMLRAPELAAMWHQWAEKLARTTVKASA